MESNDLGDIIKKQREIFNNEKPPLTEKVSKKGIKRKVEEVESEDTEISKHDLDPVLDGAFITNNENSKPDAFFTCLVEEKAAKIQKTFQNKKGFKVFLVNKATGVARPGDVHPGDIIPAISNKVNDVSTQLPLPPPIIKNDGPNIKKKFTCKICRKTFRQKIRYLKHVSSHKGADDHTTLSNLKFSNEKHITKSRKNAKNEIPTKEADTLGDTTSYINYVSKEANGVKLKYFQCSICDKQTSAKADLIKHIRVHTGERPFKCKMCNASFVQITALRGHETRHTGLKAFACDVCGKRFAIKDRLRLHMRIHTGEKPHQCHICDHSFARRSQVSQHVKIHMECKDTFKCEECDTKFASYTTLKAHVNKHMGIREFQCPACGKKFLRMEGMYKHIRTVHKGNKPYTCNICGKSFKGHLQQHLRLHMGIRPYSCNLCEASFTQNSQLTVHLRIHTGERPYKCQVCGAAFAHSSACKIHMRSHTGERPFSCVICAQSFSQLPHLKKHMKCVHKATKPYMCIICRDFFQTQEEIDCHRRLKHNYSKTPEELAQEVVEDGTLARMRNRLAVLLYRISSEDRRSKFGFGQKLVDEVLKLSLESSGHTPITDMSLTTLEELRQNVFLLLRWTIPKETMEEYHRNNMTVDEVLDMLTS